MAYLFVFGFSCNQYTWISILVSFPLPTSVWCIICWDVLNFISQFFCAFWIYLVYNLTRTYACMHTCTKLNLLNINRKDQNHFNGWLIKLFDCMCTRTYTVNVHYHTHTLSERFPFLFYSNRFRFYFFLYYSTIIVITFIIIIIVLKLYAIL